VSRPPGQVAFELVVNGEPRRGEADPEMPLLWVLRDRLGLVGPKYGCGLGACGACTVLEGERARRSCLLTLREAAGRSFTTSEGSTARAATRCSAPGSNWTWRSAATARAG
jgi:isoquinoline 1-oxidoreductase alpha subunit